MQLWHPCRLVCLGAEVCDAGSGFPNSPFLQLLQYTGAFALSVRPSSAAIDPSGPIGQRLGRGATPCQLAHQGRC